MRRTGAAAPTHPPTYTHTRTCTRTSAHEDVRKHARATQTQRSSIKKRCQRAVTAALGRVPAPRPPPPTAEITPTRERSADSRGQRQRTRWTPEGAGLGGSGRRWKDTRASELTRAKKNRDAVQLAGARTREGGSRGAGRWSRHLVCAHLTQRPLSGQGGRTEARLADTSSAGDTRQGQGRSTARKAADDSSAFQLAKRAEEMQCTV